MSLLPKFDARKLSWRFAAAALLSLAACGEGASSAVGATADATSGTDGVIQADSSNDADGQGGDAAATCTSPAGTLAVAGPIVTPCQGNGCTVLDTVVDVDGARSLRWRRVSLPTLAVTAQGTTPLPDPDGYGWRWIRGIALQDTVLGIVANRTKDHDWQHTAVALDPSGTSKDIPLPKNDFVMDLIPMPGCPCGLVRHRTEVSATSNMIGWIVHATSLTASPWTVNASDLAGTTRIIQRIGRHGEAVVLGLGQWDVPIAGVDPTVSGLRWHAADGSLVAIHDFELEAPWNTLTALPAVIDMGEANDGSLWVARFSMAELLPEHSIELARFPKPGAPDVRTRLCAGSAMHPWALLPSADDGLLVPWLAENGSTFLTRLDAFGRQSHTQLLDRRWNSYISTNVGLFALAAVDSAQTPHLDLHRLDAWGRPMCEISASCSTCDDGDPCTIDDCAEGTACSHASAAKACGLLLSPAACGR